MAPSTRYFEQLEHLALDAAGAPLPLHRIGLAILVPTIAGGEPGHARRTVTIEAADQLDGRPARIIPNTRIVEVADPRVVGPLLQSGQFREIDPPTKTQLRKAAEDTADARRTPHDRR